MVTKKAGYKRGTYYLHIKKDDLALSILESYGKAIGYDFSEEIPEMEALIIEEPLNNYNSEPVTIEEAIAKMNEWKEKYLELMEKYLKCLERD